MTSTATGSRRTDTSVCWYFAGLGATAAVVPAILPGVAVTFNVSVKSVLPAVSALFLGLLVGVLCAPALAARLALLNVLKCGAAAQAIGLTVAGLADDAGWFIAAAGIAGAGFGIVESSATAVTRLTHHARTTRRLTILTVIVGAAATVTPGVVLLFGGLGLTRLALPAAAAVHVIATITSRGAVLLSPVQPLSVATAPTGPPAGTTRTVAMLGAALFFYVGAESVLSGWSAATIVATLSTDPNMAALGTSGFWLIITFGRLLGTQLNKVLSANTAAITCSLVAASALAFSAFMADHNTIASLCLVGIATTACGPCYALILGVAVTVTSNRGAVSAASALVAVGATGGAAVPLLTLTSFDTLGPTTTASLSMATVLVLLTLAAARPRTPRHALHIKLFGPSPERGGRTSTGNTRTPSRTPAPPTSPPDVGADHESSRP